MLKGLSALFSSGVIWNPMNLIGIIFGIFCAIKLKPEMMKELYANYHLYLLALLISFVYNFVFNKPYKGGDSDDMDRTQFILNLIGGFAKLIISSLLTISFCYMISFN